MGYVWIGGAFQRFTERGGDRPGASKLLTAVYGYRPPALRTEAGKPDLRFFVEATAEDRGRTRVSGTETATAARTLFAGPTSLLLHKAMALVLLLATSPSAELHHVEITTRGMD